MHTLRPAAATAFTALMLSLAAPTAQADEFTGTGYAARELLTLCQEADNASRLIGQIAEAECEQYMNGYVDALMVAKATGAGTGICPPAQNTADEIRWAFAKWVHSSWTERTQLTAAEAIHATLLEAFPCE